jgi:prepilin-type N-terminal cleavage/methylation domain-containing protein
VNRRGVTLVEMLIVVALVGLLVGVMFPSVSSGVETLRLNQACSSIVSLLNEGLNRAERRQQAVEVTISRADRTLSLASAEAGFSRRLPLPDGVSIVRILPEQTQEDNGTRRFLLYPGGAVPRIGVEIATPRNARRIVRVDPITGVPQIERVEK